MTELRRLTRLLVTSMMTWLWIALLVRTVIALKWDGIDSGFEPVSTFAGYVILFSGFEVFSTKSSYPLRPCTLTVPALYLRLGSGKELITGDVGEYVIFIMQMMVRLGITWILAPMYPFEMGGSKVYSTMLVSWSLLGICRNFQRSWRATKAVGGWESSSLSLYISLVALRCVESPVLPNSPRSLYPIGLKSQSVCSTSFTQVLSQLTLEQ